MEEEYRRMGNWTRMPLEMSSKKLIGKLGTIVIIGVVIVIKF